MGSTLRTASSFRLCLFSSSTPADTIQQCLAQARQLQLSTRRPRRRHRPAPAEARSRRRAQPRAQGAATLARAPALRMRAWTPLGLRSQRQRLLRCWRQRLVLRVPQRRCLWQDCCPRQSRAQTTPALPERPGLGPREVSWTRPATRVRVARRLNREPEEGEKLALPGARQRLRLHRATLALLPLLRLGLQMVTQRARLGMQLLLLRLRPIPGAWTRLCSPSFT
mmetsp:Transcript_26378/g.99190  ORF Transcript_26378/g.99190 Transcript_26378/m.99190 type:complete len:224 (-) Transcript_26378:1334-2005(-)